MNCFGSRRKKIRRCCWMIVGCGICVWQNRPEVWTGDKLKTKKKTELPPAIEIICTLYQPNYSHARVSQLNFDFVYKCRLYCIHNTVSSHTNMWNVERAQTKSEHIKQVTFCWFNKIVMRNNSVYFTTVYTKNAKRPNGLWQIYDGCR